MIFENVTYYIEISEALRCSAGRKHGYHLIQFSHSVVSNSLGPHGLQHARSPCPHHQHPEFTQSHVHRVSDAIQPFHPLSSSSSPVFSLSQHQDLFQ